MNEETIDRLLQELGPITDKLGDGAEHVYRLATRQAIINGVTDLIIAVVFFIGAYVAYRVLLHAISEAKKDRLSAWGPGGPVVAIVGVFFVGVGVGHVVIALRALLNPQWAAFEIIMRAI